MKKNQIIYQMALRTFTEEGTLNAARKMLPFLASLNIDIIYLCPVFKTGNDEDESTWSPRQIASGTNNPKNPYKMADYFNVDEEYGTNEDLKAFVTEAHKNGLKVMFDLVYLHCDRNAVFIKEHPEFVESNDDGTISVGETWPFARLNFECPQLREYLLKNMEMFVSEYHVDGFRCDVGDMIPLDFWEKSFKALKKINPDLITLNEGVLPEYIESVFDMDYGYEWNNTVVDVFSGKKTADELKKYCMSEREKYGNNIHKIIRTIDTHDFASDKGADRNEITMTSKGVEAALVLNSTYCGVPFMWNGYEVCDNAENCMFSNRFYGRRSAINWSRAFTAEGMHRREFIKNINNLHHNTEELYNGEIQWLSNDKPQQIISYVKRTESSASVVIVNTANESVDVTVDVNIGEIYMKSDAVISDKIILGAYGYIIAAAD